MTTEGPTSEPAEVTPTAADSGEAAPVVEADAPALAAPGSITSDAETSARVEPEPLVEPAADRSSNRSRSSRRPWSPPLPHPLPSSKRPPSRSHP